jgi:hypothetical protein
MLKVATHQQRKEIKLQPRQSVTLYARDCFWLIFYVVHFNIFDVHIYIYMYIHIYIHTRINQQLIICANDTSFRVVDTFFYPFIEIAFVTAGIFLFNPYAPSLCRRGCFYI